jgi:hypothetical protein
VGAKNIKEQIPDLVTKLLAESIEVSKPFIEA